MVFKAIDNHAFEIRKCLDLRVLSMNNRKTHVTKNGKILKFCTSKNYLYKGKKSSFYNVSESGGGGEAQRSSSFRFLS